METKTVFTVGHSTRSMDAFLALLIKNKVDLVVDIRTIPRSRHNPQFNKENLPQPLSAAGIEYRHMPGLGGLRHALNNSPNMGWDNASFRGFADYMQTPEFEENLQELIQLIQGETIAIMCAEAVPWRCHRSLIADALAVRGVKVEHILSENSLKPHSLTPFAKIEGTKIIYPEHEAQQKLDL